MLPSRVMRMANVLLMKPLSLGMFRSDYMVHQDTSVSPPSLQAKQVEFNTIASSFGGLSRNTSELHK